MKKSIIGTLHVYHNFSSRHVPTRPVAVWLPPGHESAARLPVIYMQDGQNLFDPATSSIGVDWGMDEAVTRLAAEQDIGPAMVVGVWNTSRRWREYMPAKALDLIANSESAAESARELGGPPAADDYLRFLVTEVKPWVDREYPARPDRANTLIMGSSMGALLALYALCEYPDIFGGAGCLSTHWPAGNGIVTEYARAALPAPGHHRLYFDYGTETLDADYAPYQARMDAVMAERGYTPGRDWLTRRFAGADHSERAWRRRVDIPLAFLLREARGKGFSKT
ncbi:MAG: alpha/beta hydrolase [Desulfosudaceae bacterium]